MDIYKIILGIAFFSLGLIISIPNVKEKIAKEPDQFGSTLKGLIAGILFIIGGIIIFIKEFLHRGF